jgi:hypothetical protein
LASVARKNSFSDVSSEPIEISIGPGTALKIQLADDRSEEWRLKSSRDIDQATFDAWHAKCWKALMRATDPGKMGGGVTLGQAQKWVNMRMKYAVDGRLAGFERLEALAHVPIDRMLLASL